MLAVYNMCKVLTIHDISYPAVISVMTPIWSILIFLATLPTTFDISNLYLDYISGYWLCFTVGVVILLLLLLLLLSLLLLLMFRVIDNNCRPFTREWTTNAVGDCSRVDGM